MASTGADPLVIFESGSVLMHGVGAGSSGVLRLTVPGTPVGRCRFRQTGVTLGLLRVRWSCVFEV